MDEKFKVDDWVQVIPSASADDDLGKIFQIKEPMCDGIYYRTKDTNREYWPFVCLRKLSEEEVKEMNSNKESCHRHPERTCGLNNIVNRMDCAICEQTHEMSKVRKDATTIKDSESEIREIANQVSFFLGKRNHSLDDLKRLHQKFYELEDCMKSILWDEEVKRRQK